MAELLDGNLFWSQTKIVSLQNYASRSTSLDKDDTKLVEDLTVLEEKIHLKEGLMKIRSKVSILTRSENDDVEQTM